jgi:hypothetical protein
MSGFCQYVFTLILRTKVPKYKFTNAVMEATFKETSDILKDQPDGDVFGYSYFTAYTYRMPGAPAKLDYITRELDYTRVMLEWEKVPDHLQAGKPTMSHRVQKKKIRNPGVFLTQCEREELGGNYCVYGSYYRAAVAPRKVIPERTYTTKDAETIVETRMWYGALTTRELGSGDLEIELDVFNNPEFFVPRVDDTVDGRPPERIMADIPVGGDFILSEDGQEVS